jgi:shikimate dehydrogenase
MIRELNLDGANITVPFKEEAFRICDELDAYASKIGAVNTIVVKNGKFIGKNSDAPGFMMAIKDFGNIKNALVLGAGGTARAVAFALKNSGVDVKIINRSAGRLEFFKKEGFDVSTFDGYEPENCDILVNTTSAGLTTSELPCDEKRFVKMVELARFGFDVVYGKQTIFLQKFAEARKPFKDGSDMLLFQAFLAFESFVQSNFDRDEVLKTMRESFLL